MEVVITTQGVAFLSDTTAVVGAEGIPLRSAAPYRKASLYSGIWTPADAQAALQVYRQWHEKEGELGRFWIDQGEAAEAEAPAIDATIQRLAGLRSLTDSVLHAISEHAPLPAWDHLRTGNRTALELAALLDTLAPFPTDLLDEDGGYFKDRLAELRDIYGRAEDKWRSTLAKHQHLREQVLVLVQTQPLMEPPMVLAVHDGTHILDIPECYTIGASKEKAYPCLS